MSSIPLRACSALTVTFFATCFLACSSTAATGGDAGPASPDGATSPVDAATGADAPSSAPDAASSPDGAVASDADVDAGAATDAGGDDAAPASDAAGGGACSTGTLVEGDVNYGGGGAAPNPAGQGLLADPPVPIRKAVFAGDVMHAATSFELWGADFSQATPSIVRYAGVNPATEGDDSKFQAGACASARFGGISGVVAAGDGSLFVTDEIANAVVHVTSPASGSCGVAYYAGTSTAEDMIPADGVNAGSQDGTGATAQFNEPHAPVVDPAGNVYVLDQIIKIRKIAADAAHTVSTLVTLPTDTQDTYSSMTYLNGKLYVVHLEQDLNAIVEVDPTSGAQRTVLAGTDGTAFPPLDPSELPAFSSITNDGTNLLLTGKAYVWSLTTAGAITWIAGDGEEDYQSGYDPTAAHGAKDLELPGMDDADLAYRTGAIFFHGVAGSESVPYEVKIACP